MEFKQWKCSVCGYIYSERDGHPGSGASPGTRFEDLPDDWECPSCGAPKEDFELVEE